MAEPLVVLADVRRTFQPGWSRARPVDAVDGVDLQIAAGEAVALVGPSGAGKTTLARMIVGLEPPDGGHVRLFGVDLQALCGQRRREILGRIGIIFQDPYAALSPNARVLDIVLEPLLVHGFRVGAARNRAIEVLEEVGLGDERFRHRYPGELSGGERQRIALARAIALRPDLLVADEPTSMLDASRQTEFLALIRGLRAGHQMSLVYITHDLALAAAACDRIVVLDAGRVIESGPTADVVSRPRESVTRALVAAVRARADAVSRVRGDRPTIQVPSPR